VLRHLIDSNTADTVPITVLAEDELAEWRAGQDGRLGAWLDSIGFEAKPGQTALCPGPEGALSAVLVGRDTAAGLWGLAGLPGSLPQGAYHLDNADDPEFATKAALAWALGCYRFERYRKAGRAPARLAWPEAADRTAVAAAATGTGLVRDLVNTPAEDMGPEELADAAEQLAGEFEARITVLSGDALLAMVEGVEHIEVGEPRALMSNMLHGYESFPASFR